jgi:hypothetical protein
MVPFCHSNRFFVMRLSPVPPQEFFFRVLGLGFMASSEETSSEVLSTCQEGSTTSISGFGGSGKQIGSSEVMRSSTSDSSIQEEAEYLSISSPSCQNGVSRQREYLASLRGRMW